MFKLPIGYNETFLPDSSFLSFIWKNRTNKRLLWLALAGLVAQFIVFKFFYPFADFFGDSYWYIYAAYAHLDVCIWPIGYSKFLGLVHMLTYSDTALVAIQYFLLETGALYFFFTLLYFFNPSRTSRLILYAFLFFNPLFLYFANYINSDPLFAALSLFWFTQLLWIMYRPRFYQIFVHGILLFFCFAVRNNAYYYPLISILAFLLSQQRVRTKLAGIGFPILLILVFVQHTREEAYKITGTRQFSLFTGWQLANNALYMYEYCDTAKQLSTSSEEIENLAKSFYLGVPKDFHKNFIFSYTGNFFIREPLAPLKIYMSKHYEISDYYSETVAWGKCSAIFAEYGSSLIRHNLSSYFWEFVVPNAGSYFIPPMEKFELYNLGDDRVDPIAKTWFHYKTEKIWVVSKSLQGKVLFIFPGLFLAFNLYVVGVILLLFFRHQFRVPLTVMNRSFLIGISFCLANFLFIIAATTNIMRYQCFPMILFLTYALLISEWMERKEAAPDHKDFSRRTIIPLEQGLTNI